MKYTVKQEKQILGHFHFHEQLDEAARGDKQQIDKQQKKVLILHSGGTIGMFRDSEGKFRPQKNKFKHFLQNYPYFCDEDETYFNSKDGFTITPPSIYKRKIWYKFREFDKLIDSTNSNVSKINEVMYELQKQYDKYDAFVILHGTDTMAYTASALSFMIQNLKKTVVVTGAQVPMGEVRNDSINNLLCALTVAGHFVIPEVLLVFDNKILRGNRATKTSASNFNSFKSPNFIPLGYLNLKINIHWQMIHHCKQDQQTKFVPLKYEVETMKITPFSNPTIPKSKYIVIESLGTGNIPTQGPYSEWFKANSKLPKEQQKVIVNISQVYQSVILNIYATGNQATKLGLIPGSDMTCEAAMAKLSYLASKGFTQGEQLKELMMTNLREELTETKDRLMTTKANYVLKCMTILEKKFAKQPKQYQQMLTNIVYPLLVAQRVSKSTIDRIDQATFFDAVNYKYADGGNMLHYYSKIKHLNDHEQMFLRFLLEKGVDPNLKDQEGNSPLFYALLTGKYHEAEILKQCGSKLFTTSKRVFEAVRNDELALLHALVKFGDDLSKYKNSEERNLAMYSVINSKKDVANFLNDFTELFEEESLEIKDIYGNDVNFYIQKFNFSFQ